MTQDLEVRCECGKLRGMATDLEPASVNRAVCYCDDCQSFAHFLGRADDVLDAHDLLDDFEGDVHQLIARFGGKAP